MRVTPFQFNRERQQKPTRNVIAKRPVDFVVGPIFSNILAAIMKPVTEGAAILISPNAGTSNFAGKECNPNFFVTSYQNDQVFAVSGKHAQDSGIKKVLLMAPNYQAGKDALAGFKAFFRGEIADEVYVPLNQLDFSAELAKIAAAKPDAIYAFLPGGMGVNFVKQFRQAGLADHITFLSAFTVDESTLPAQQDAALGFFGAANWAPDLDNPQNKAFVASYEKEFGAVPATYAFQSYDAALLIDSAVRQVQGNLANRDALRAAMMKADFKSLRGGFRFNTNQYPIQNYYVRTVGSDGKGGLINKSFNEPILKNHGDAYVQSCAMK